MHVRAFREDEVNWVLSKNFKYDVLPHVMHKGQLFQK